MGPLVSDRNGLQSQNNIKWLKRVRIRKIRNTKYHNEYKEDKKRIHKAHPKNGNPDSGGQGHRVEDGDPLQLCRSTNRVLGPTESFESLAQVASRLLILEHDLVDGGHGGRPPHPDVRNPEIDALVDTGQDVPQPRPNSIRLATNLANILQNDAILLAATENKENPKPHTNSSNDKTRKESKY